MVDLSPRGINELPCLMLKSDVTLWNKKSRLRTKRSRLWRPSNAPQWSRTTLNPLRWKCQFILIAAWRRPNISLCFTSSTGHRYIFGRNSPLLDSYQCRNSEKNMGCDVSHGWNRTRNIAVLKKKCIKENKWCLKCNSVTLLEENINAFLRYI